jgi:hypothetical protein
MSLNAETGGTDTKQEVRPSTNWNCGQQKDNLRTERLQLKTKLCSMRERNGIYCSLVKAKQSKRNSVFQRVSYIHQRKRYGSIRICNHLQPTGALVWTIVEMKDAKQQKGWPGANYSCGPAVVDGLCPVQARSGLVKRFINKRVIAAGVHKRVLSKNSQVSIFPHLKYKDTPRLVRVMHRVQC